MIKKLEARLREAEASAAAMREALDVAAKWAVSVPAPLEIADVETVGRARSLLCGRALLDRLRAAEAERDALRAAAINVLREGNALAARLAASEATP
jgi:hypothetical protein